MPPNASMKVNTPCFLTIRRPEMTGPSKCLPTARFLWVQGGASGTFNGQGLGTQSEKAIKTVHVSESKLAESSIRAQKKGQGQEEGEGEKKEGRGPALDLSSRREAATVGVCVLQGRARRPPGLFAP